MAEALPLEASTDGGATWRAVLGVVPAEGVGTTDLAVAATRAGVTVDLLPLTGALLADARQALETQAGPARG